MTYKEFLTLLEKFFKTNSNLKYVNEISVSKDFNDIINGSFPILNMEPDGMQFEKHPELMYKEYQKRTFKIYFTLGIQDDSYKTSVLGNRGKKGITDLMFDFEEALKDFETAYRYDTSSINSIKLNRDKLVMVQRTLKLNESGKFLACAETVVEFFTKVKL